jgi:hypothetical protein
MTAGNGVYNTLASPTVGVIPNNSHESLKLLVLRQALYIAIVLFFFENQLNCYEIWEVNNNNIMIMKPTAYLQLKSRRRSEEYIDF